MDISNSFTYRKDLEKATQLVDLEKFRRKSLLITGAGGLICSAIIDLLLWLNKNYGLAMSIYAAGRDIDQLQRRFSQSSEQNGLHIIEYDATREISFDFSVDFIIHGASNATPLAYISQPVDTMLSNIKGVHELLQYALRTSVLKTVYISSSEVYGKQLKQSSFKEDDYGTIELLNIRSSYPIAKQAGETLCMSYVSQFKCNVCIVRPGHIYGPTATEKDNRVSSMFAKQAALGQEITLKSNGKQLRSYCYCLDCATAILAVLLKGKSGQAYNISNPTSIITLEQMAMLLAEYGQVALNRQVPSATEQAAFNPMRNSSLDASKLEALGWKGIFNAADGFRHTVIILKELYG